LSNKVQQPIIFKCKVIINDYFAAKFSASSSSSSSFLENVLTKDINLILRRMRYR